MTPKSRHSLYLISSIATSVVGLALLYGGLSAGAANSVTEIITGLAALLGATGPAVAARKVNEQSKDGTFDALSPADQIAQGMRAVKEQAVTVQEQMKVAREQAEAAQELLKDIVGDAPVLGPVVRDALNRIQF